MEHRILLTIALFALMVSAPVFSAPPPETMNYQGVLRDGTGDPLNGGHDMIFRFYDAEFGGAEILVDRHLAAGTGAVQATDGLFSASLGGGAITDGTGPGSYTTLGAVFRDYGQVWMAITIGAETLSPRVQVQASAYAMNAGTLEGRPASGFLDTGSTTQTKVGTLHVDAVGVAESTGLTASGAARGVEGYGSLHGGYFADSNDSGFGWVGYGHEGMRGYGTTAGGIFASQTTVSDASTGWGVKGYGSSGGGLFRVADNSGYAYVGQTGYGILGYGTTMGGYFKDSNASGYLRAGYGDSGVAAYGNTYGGYFKDLNSSGFAYLGTGDYGIDAVGSVNGGRFQDADSSGWARVAYGDEGIHAVGSQVGGYFTTGTEWSSNLDTGVIGVGTELGGTFRSSTGNAYAHLGLTGSGGYGAWAEGDWVGGYFKDRNSSSYGFVGYSSYKIYGTGSVNFVQNHPEDKTKVIVYTAPEGDEAATYTRGSGRLVNGEARIALGETFQWVTNPSIGLTAHVTPRGEAVPLAVVALGTREMVVRGPTGGPNDLVFDYLVYGLRIGFEEATVVQPKLREAYIPSMKDHRDMYADNPGLRRFNAVERFRGMAVELNPGADGLLDLSEAHALREAVHEYDPDVDRIEEGDPVEFDTKSSTSRSEPVHAADRSPDTATVATVASVTGSSAMTTDMDARPVDLPGGVSFPVSVPVSAGDLLVFDPDRPGMLMPASSAQDAGVVGIAAGDAVTVDGGLEVALVEMNFAELKVDAGYGEIRRGDLLTSSFTPGHAMRATELIPGTVIAKALDELATGAGTIRVLLLAR